MFIRACESARRLLTTSWLLGQQGRLTAQERTYLTTEIPPTDVQATISTDRHASHDREATKSLSASVTRAVMVVRSWAAMILSL